MHLLECMKRVHVIPSWHSCAAIQERQHQSTKAKAAKGNTAGHGKQKTISHKITKYKAAAATQDGKRARVPSTAGRTIGALGSAAAGAASARVVRSRGVVDRLLLLWITLGAGAGAGVVRGVPHLSLVLLVTKVDIKTG